MSSAIIFINKLGVAVAADSAATVGERAAIFNTAQKIFPIGRTDKAQVLAIIVGNPMFMGVPIELIFKKYSKFIEDHSFSKNTIEDYITDFIRFVEEHQYDFAFKDSENKYMYRLVVGIFDEMFENLLQKTTDSSEIPEEVFLKDFFGDLSNKVKENIDYHATIEKKDQTQNMVGKEFIEKNHPLLIEKVFKDRLTNFLNKKNGTNIIPDKMVLDETDIRLLSYFKTLVYESMNNHNTYKDNSISGIYFVGYGEKSLYPSYWGIESFAFLNGKVIYQLDYRRIVRAHEPAHFKTLAQDDIILSIISNAGVRTRYELFNIVQSTLESTTSMFIEKNPESKEIISQFKTKIDTNFNKLDAFDEYSTYQGNRFLKSLAVMRVADMAEYAENLISLQSLKRKYELDAQNNATVGGPTDVAIITKFEGFKWVKSKNTNS
jgi:hypothetical protein